MLAEVLLTHAEKKWLCRISSFYEKRKTKLTQAKLFETVETYGFFLNYKEKNVRKFPQHD